MPHIMMADSIQRENYLKIGPFSLKFSIINTFFAVIAIVSQASMNITYPLWIDSTNSLTSKTPSFQFNESNEWSKVYNVTDEKTTHHAHVDAYFALVFTTIANVVISGTGLLFLNLFYHGETKSSFPHRNVMWVSFLMCVSQLLISFSCSGTRTPPLIQGILVNATVPITLIMRLVKLPNI